MTRGEDLAVCALCLSWFFLPFLPLVALAISCWAALVLLADGLWGGVRRWRESRWHRRLTRTVEVKRWRTVELRNRAIDDIVKLRRDAQQEMRRIVSDEVIDAEAWDVDD